MSRKETPWLPLDNTKYLQADTESGGGGVVHTRMRSSFELPLSVRIVYDEMDQEGSFEFRYAFEEDGRDFTVDGATLTLGRHSLRVLRIQVPASPDHAETPAQLMTVIAPKAIAALEKFRSNPRRWQIQEDNIFLTEAAIQNEQLPLRAYT